LRKHTTKVRSKLVLRSFYSDMDTFAATHSHAESRIMRREMLSCPAFVSSAASAYARRSGHWSVNSTTAFSVMDACVVSPGPGAPYYVSENNSQGVAQSPSAGIS